MENGFCWHELLTTDPEGAKRFYSELFHWTLEDADMEGTPYTFVKVGGEPAGGIMAKPAPEAPTMWMTYIQTGDLEGSVARAQELGGNVLHPKTAAGTFGHFAVIQDPTGGVFALWQTAAQE